MMNAPSLAPYQLLPQPETPARRTTPPCVPLSSIADGDLALLGRIRDAAKRARCGRNLALQEAHRSLACPGAASFALEALVRTFGEVIGRRPVFHAPGAKLVSFDEAWLLRCHAAQTGQDIDTLAFLMRGRVAEHLRRAFLDLLRAT